LDCGENHAILVAKADGLSSDADTLYELAAELECAPSSAPSAEPSETPTSEATSSKMPSDAPSTMPTAIACSEVSNETVCESLDYCEWVEEDAVSTTRMLRQTRRHKGNGDDDIIIVQPPDRADDRRTCQPKEVPPKNDNGSSAPSSSPTPECECECSTKSSKKSSKKTTGKSKSKTPKSQSSSSTSTPDTTQTRKRRRKHIPKKLSNQNSRRLGGIDRIDLEPTRKKANEFGHASTYTSITTEETQRERSDRIAKLEREYFASTDIDFEAATLEEKYEAMLIAFSIGGVEDDY